MKSFTTFAVLAALLSVSFARVQVVRAPMDEYRARLQNEMKDCLAIYTVFLEPKFSNQGNDLSHSAPHGKDTRAFGSLPAFKEFSSKPGQDYVGEPFKNDPVRQARAKAASSVTALTELEVATPLGFRLDTLRMMHAVCVDIRGEGLTLGRRWVEIMAQTLAPKQQICVSDWRLPNLAENPASEACGLGELYQCRDTTSETGAGGAITDSMSVKFYCREGCTDPDFGFYWRISASQMEPRQLANGAFEQRDGEDWCTMRAGDDYPTTLLNPYPDNYVPPAVFELSASSAASASISILAIVIAAIAALLL